MKSAQSFVSSGAEGVGTHLNCSVGVSPASPRGIPAASSKTTGKDAFTFRTSHVNGTMPTARREHEMRDFRAAPRAVISNARCLTEGVDVPDVDMVALLSPRRSRVDIVQATGRAMRRSPGKTTGYVLVPLYVELAGGETVEAAVKRGGFDEVWDVLQSMQEQDDVFAEIIREMREERGRTKGFDDSRFREKVDVICPSISLDSLRETITTVCLSRLARLSWRPFEQAREFVRSLRLKRATEWREYSKSNRRPADIPAAPNHIYRQQGWVDWGDWLGTGRIANTKRQYLTFEEAREFARSLPVNGQQEWVAIVRRSQSFHEKVQFVLPSSVAPLRGLRRPAFRYSESARSTLQGAVDKLGRLFGTRKTRRPRTGEKILAV
ncbi:MAG: helicase-related protein [Verrucomicrobiota bacterium]